MAKVRVRPETGTLYLDFHFRGKRCREQTALPDTPTNRRVVEALARRIQRDLATGSFEYARHFPDSPRARKFAEQQADTAQPDTDSGKNDQSPTFKEFAETWFKESVPNWRTRYRTDVRNMLDRHMIPGFGDRRLGQIKRGDVLDFRAEFAKRPGRGRANKVSARRINKVVGLLCSIIAEGCDRHGLVSPANGIKPLRQGKTEIHPFTLDEIKLMIECVRPDYRAYLITRFFTGLRTGEVNGLHWQDIDFTTGVIEVRRSSSRGGDGGLKTPMSRRVIPMVPGVREALWEHRATRREDCPWVFHTRTGKPIDAANFTTRIWNPLLQRLGLERRNPYQTRHTAATLMLASGENPEWVANVLGHATTEMLFRVYSRYVPNLTRQDGRAFVGMLAESTDPESEEPEKSLSGLEDMTGEQMRAVLKALLEAKEQHPLSGECNEQQ